MSFWGFVKLAGTRSRSGPVQWIRYWSDPLTSLSKDLTCFMLWDDRCMILWQDSFVVHLAYCRVALFQRCSHYGMPVSFLLVIVYVSQIANLCPIQSINFCIHSFMPIFRWDFMIVFLFWVAFYCQVAAKILLVLCSCGHVFFKWTWDLQH